MKLFLNSLAFLLLLLNGTGAIYGGWLLITSPDGSSLQLPLDYLKSSPFETYLIPGIILFTVNGLFSFLTLLLMILKNKKVPWFILAQGVMLTGWIIVQVIMIQVFHPFQLIFGIVGIILMGIGWNGKAKTQSE
ncbi:MAG: hypothetical protein J0L62_14115 [Bacteroidetes bacterium]|nr:hypothetical protein [Bacteroidota bacterium]